jgi:F-type H+-transporting ATPase subunit delta
MAELTTLARPYAKAAFEYANAHGALAQWSSMFATLAGVAAEERVSQQLDAPALTAEQQAKLLLDLCGDALDAAGANFVRTLAANKRLPLLATIRELFEQFKAQQEKSVEVEITSAFELDAAMQEKLATALKSKLSRDVKLHASVDPSLVGGVVIRAGDTVIDSSVRGRLAKLAEAMNS